MSLPAPEKLKKYWPIIDLVVVGLLIVIFGLLYGSQHSWGAWGDDSPGYIYTAGQFISGESLVVQDSLVQQGLAAFGDEKLARWLAPTHHEIISPDGWTASKYPIGLSWLMYLASLLTGIDEAIYLVVPLLAMGVVVLTYALPIVWLKDNPAAKRSIGIIAALSVGLANLFINYAVAQPMRDIPALFFFTLAAVGLGIYIKLFKSKRAWLVYPGLFLIGSAFGYGMNIRETNAILLIPFILVLVMLWREEKISWKSKKIWQPIIIFSTGLLMMLSLTVWNSYSITEHKEKFRDKDITRIAITSNIDHIQSLKIKNIYNNEGKYRPGVGGGKQYWNVITQMSPWPPFMFVVLFGLVMLVYRQRKAGVFFVSWAALIFLLFSMWINPYPRYILALFPAVAVGAGYGLIEILRMLQKDLGLRIKTWLVISALMGLSFFISLQPSVSQRLDAMIAGELVFKSISHDDLDTIKQVSTDIENASSKEPLLLMLGQWKAGISETIMTHSDLRVIRFPRKQQEQPPYDEMVTLVEELAKTYDVFIWYDGSTNALEQKFSKQVSSEEVIAIYDFSFQSGVTVSPIEFE